jgi:glycine/D-amino acid oxidase-like deaminating enzyme
VAQGHRGREDQQDLKAGADRSRERMARSSPKIVICGAGIAGIAAAYSLAVEHGLDDVTIVEQGNPLSLTSDKSTEAYRNWWPGPDWAMTAFMNRSIDLIEKIAHATGNRINMNRRGYLFATADAAKIPFLQVMATRAEAQGSGPARTHDTAASPYVPSPERGFDVPLTGADVITDASLIRRHFPYLAPQTVAVAHARRAGWLSAQQLGMVMLEVARERGVKLLRGQVVDIDAGERVRTVHVECAGERRALDAAHLVLAAGPMLKQMAALIGVELPIMAERHFKISLPDTLGIMRSAPMLIWLDEQCLPWSDEERAALTEDDEARWLLEKFPPGAHGRPDGAGTLVALFNHHGGAADIVFPLPEEPHYAEIVLRGMSTMVPALKAYIGQGARPYVDGGYYIKTRENRPLVGPLPVEGAYVSGAFSGFGVMASCAGGELLARHITGRALPDYAPNFLLSRYQDPDYCTLLDKWGDGGQL